MLVINSREYLNAAIYCVENGVLGYGIMGKLEKTLADTLLLLSDYQPATGQTACLSCGSASCGEGSYLQTACSVTANRACAQCGAGAYSDTAAATACTACPVGSFQNGTGKTDASACLPCCR